MFNIRCISPLDEEWEERDAQLEKVAGSRPHRTFASKSSNGETGERVCLWLEPDFTRALALRKKLARVAGVRLATVEEHSSREEC